MKKKWRNILLAAFGICLVLAAAAAVASREEPLHYLLDVTFSDGRIYGVDDDEEKVRFFVAETSGEIVDQITVDREDGGGVYNVYDYISLDDGKMYVYGMKIDTVTNSYLDESVYYCNFEEGRLEHYQTLPVVYSDGQNNLAVQVKDGQVTYLTYEFWDDLVVTVHRMDEAGNVAQIHELYFDPYINIYDYAYSDEWRLVFLTPDNRIFRSLEDGSSEQVYPQDGGLHQLTDFYYDGGDKVYVTDIAVGQALEIDLNGGTRVLYDLAAPLEGGYAFSDLEKIRYQPDGSFCALVQLDSNTSGVGLYEGGAFHVLQSLTWGAQACLRTFLWTFLWAALAALLLLGAGKLFLRITRNRYPILAKMILALIPVVIVSAFVTRYYTQRNMTNELMNAQYRELYQNSQNFLAGVDEFYWTGIDPAEAYETPEYFDFQDIFFNRGGSAVELLGDAGGESSYLNYFSYLFAYRLGDDGVLYSYFCDPQPVNTPVEYKQSRKLVEDFYECAEKGLPIKGEYRDKFGNWSVVLVPVFDGEGNVAAVLESGMSKVLVDYNIGQEIRYLTIVNLLIMSAMMVLIAVILTYGLYPLKRLKRGVEEMLDGHFGVTVPVRGRDEIAEISEVFNRMSRNIQNHISQMERFNRASFRFIPSQIFTLLKKEGVADVEKGDHTTCPTTALSFHTVTFHTRMRTMNGEEMYRFINRILSITAPVVQQKGGVISQFENAGIEGFFTDSCETALSCAVSICQEMQPLEEEPGFTGAKPAIGLHYGQTKLGIIGTDERLEAVAISESTNLAQFLRKIAPKYAARILVTGTLLEQVP